MKWLDQWLDQNPIIRHPKDQQSLLSDAGVLLVEVSAGQPRMPTSHETSGTDWGGRFYLIGACSYLMGV